MRTHVTTMLYDYVVNQLPAAERGRVEIHLVTCQRCTVELKEMQSAIVLAKGEVAKPSDQLPEEYWQSFAVEVERRIHAEECQGVRSLLTLRERLTSFFRLHSRPVFAYGGALAAVVLAVILWRGYQSDERANEVASIRRPTVQVIPANDRMSQYFRKSRSLLVGISNMKLDKGEPIDLSVERKASRELVKETRDIKNGRQLDLQSARLVGDLEKILIELSNTKELGGVPSIEVIQSGIQQENLLFKVRMAESLHDSTRYLAAQNTFEGVHQ